MSLLLYLEFGAAVEMRLLRPRSRLVDDAVPARRLTRFSINFNVVSKGLGNQRMAHYLTEAASEIRDMLIPTLEQEKAKL